MSLKNDLETLRKIKPLGIKKYEFHFEPNPAAPQRSTDFFAALVAKLKREDISDLLMHYPNEFAKLKELINARNK